MDKNIEFIINFLNEVGNVSDKSVLDFNDIYNRLSNNIFEILNYEIPVPSELLDDHKKLISTLEVLRNNKFVFLNDIQKNTIIQSEVYQACLNYIKNKIEKLRKGKMDDVFELVSLFKNLNGEMIDDSLINKFYDFISKYKVPLFDAEKALVCILNYNACLYENVINTGLTNEELIAVFEKYGYSYNKVPEEYKGLLVVNGNLSNIESLFIKFKEYNIPFNEKNISFIYFLIKSDSNIFDHILELSKKYDYNILDLIKKVPSIFLHKNKFMSEGNGGSFSSNNTGHSFEINGTYEDFENTIVLFDSIGYDFSTVIEKCPSILVASYDKLKRNVDLLFEYGFSKNLAASGFKLSAFKSNDILLTLDKFIELGELKYVQDNTSRLAFGSDSFIFDRLYFAKKYNSEHSDKFIIKRQFSKKEVLTGIIYNKEDRTLDSLIDKSSVTNYVFSADIDKEINSFIESFDYSSCDICSDELISSIEGNVVSNLEYMFDGVIISRPKTIRVYSALVSHYDYDKKLLLLFALTYNSILDHDEFEVIKGYVKGREK